MFGGVATHCVFTMAQCVRGFRINLSGKSVGLLAFQNKAIIIENHLYQQHSFHISMAPSDRGLLAAESEVLVRGGTLDCTLTVVDGMADCLL